MLVFVRQFEGVAKETGAALDVVNKACWQVGGEAGGGF